MPENQTAARRIGLLPVADCFGDAHVRRMLPPEHSIVASKSDPTFGLTDYLIEGPSVPLGDPAHAPTLDVLFTMHLIEGDRVRLTAEWQRCVATANWTIGEWDSMDAYRDEIEKLRGG